MNSFWLTLILLACSVSIAQAQQIALRSGDHPTFTRLTAPLPNGQNWQALRTTHGVEVMLPGFTGSFDTSDVFRRITQDRVAKIAQDGDVLTLQITCDCDATAFRIGSLLVVDVADQGTPLAGPPLQASTARPQEIVTAKKEDPAQARSALPWIGSGSPFIDLPAKADIPKPDAEAPNDRNALSDRTALLNQVRENLVERVATAASSGLLESSMQAPEPTPVSAPRTVVTPVLEPRDLPEAIQYPSRNIRITSSLDLPVGFGNSTLGLPEKSVSCPADGLFEIGDWGDDASFSAQLGPKRNALMNARDQLNPGAAEALAKLYIYFGFGAEAMDVLRLEPSVVSAHPELMTIAHILEYDTAHSSNPLAPFIDCTSDVALWATLSLHEIPSEARIDTNAALRAVNNLPKHLRQIIAPALSAQLLAYGEPDAAASAMRSIERLPEPPTPEAIMAQAGLAIEAGEPASALLEEVIETNTEQSPEALVNLVKAKLAKDEPLPYEMATLVDAYVQELRGTEMGNQLRLTQVIALSQSRHFDDAFAALHALEPSLSLQASKNLRQTVLDQLGAKAEDLVFLEHTFAQTEAALADLPTNTKLMLATRLMDLGFGAQVQQLIESIPDRPRKSERQLLAARAAIQLQQPFQAQAALVGIDGPPAALLLAQAKEMVGEYRQAFEIFTDNDAIDQAAQAAWLSEDWRDLTSSDTSDFGAVAAMARGSKPEDDPSIGPLGLADRALEESAAARNTLEKLLSDSAIQIAPKS